MYFAYCTRLVVQSCDSRAGAAEVTFVAIFELELRRCTSRALALQSCDFRAGAAEVSVLRVLHLYYKVGVCELELRRCSSRTRLVLQSCHVRAGAAELYFAYYLVLKCCGCVETL